MAPSAAVLVGCGSRGQAHARALADSDRFELAAVCDLDAERARETAETFGIDDWYADLDEAASTVDPAHVSTVTPPTIRASIVADVLAHDVGSVLVEKPPANTLDELEEIEALADDADARVTVCYETLWAEEIRAVREWLREGRLGDVRRLVGTTKGGLAGQGSHFLHMLDWLRGTTPETVRAFAEGHRSLDPGRNAQVPDHSEPHDTVLELDYGDERAFCHFGKEAPDEPAQAGTYWLEYRLDVVGTGGHASFVHGDHAQATFADGTTEHVDARDFDAGAYMTRGLYDALGAVLDGERADHPADLDSALAAARTADAAMRSAKRGRAIPPARSPPPGPTTNERLRRSLAARTPVTVSTLMFGERDRETTLSALADAGVEAVDLWGMSMFADHVDPGDPAAVRADLDRYGLECPVVSVFDDPPVGEKLDVAAAVGAETVVMGGHTPDRPETFDADELETWLDRAAGNDLTLAFENHLDTLETVDEMASLLEALDHEAAGICLAPTHLRLAGGRVEEALSRLGEDVAVVFLWVVEPGLDRGDADAFWWERADSQVPGGGGGVDFEHLLDLTVEHCPEAHWTMCYHGTEEWSTERIRESVARGVRYVEARRP
jgi:predicted dehydrogenase/sugar phosphate isomerase/epimerase